jgi:tetraacyldisaccharide 4'-kinase
MKPYRILLPFSYLYGVIMAIRNAFFENKIFRSVTISIPVISVGNMTTGGTGKTPIVELIASQCMARGLRTAIVSRGYGRRSRGLVLVSDGSGIHAGADQAGDEPLQLAHRLAGAIVIVDEDRVRGARYAQDELHAGIVVLDDGFQHRRLGRTIDLVVLDAGQDLFHMAMLPAGHRREPLASLKRADAFIITKCVLEADAERIRRELQKYAALAPVVTSSYAPDSVIDAATGTAQHCMSLSGVSAVAFCGIGNPENFRRTCEDAGVKIASFHAFDDHHRYDDGDFRMLAGARKAAHAAIFLTTEKDASRIGGRFLTADAPVQYIRMRARFNEPDRIEAIIDKIL